MKKKQKKKNRRAHFSMAGVARRLNAIKKKKIKKKTIFNSSG